MLNIAKGETCETNPVLDFGKNSKDFIKWEIGKFQSQWIAENDWLIPSKELDEIKRRYNNYYENECSKLSSNLMSNYWKKLSMVKNISSFVMNFHPITWKDIEDSSKNFSLSKSLLKTQGNMDWNGRSLLFNPDGVKYSKRNPIYFDLVNAGIYFNKDDINESKNMKNLLKSLLHTVKDCTLDVNNSWSYESWMKPFCQRMGRNTHKRKIFLRSIDPKIEISDVLLDHKIYGILKRHEESIKKTPNTKKKKTQKLRICTKNL